MGLMAALLLLLGSGVSVAFIYRSVAKCSACQEANLMPDVEEETTTLA